MDDLSVTLLLCIFPPFFMMMPVLRGRARTLILFAVFGISAAFCAGHLNTLISSLTGFSVFQTTVSIAPFVEETLKALPVVLFAFLLDPDRRKLSECAVLCGLGFALYENAWFFDHSADTSLLFGFFRGFGAGMVHSLCTLFIAIGLSMFGTKRRWSIIGTISLLSMSALFHATYNVLVQSSYYYVAPLMTLIAYTLVLLYLRKKDREHQKERAATVETRNGGSAS